MSKLVYVAGDSFPAGVELADTTLPGYPGMLPINVTTPNPEIDRTWYKKKPEIVARLNLDLDAENKKRSWPAKLQSDNINVVNSSIGGASMESISKRILIDLERFTPDVVIVQITGIPRITYTDDSVPYLISSLPIFAINSIGMKSESHRRILRAATMIKTDNEFLIDYLFSLQIINHTVKLKTGSYPILVDSCFLDRNKIYFDNLTIESQEMEMLKSASRYDFVDKTSMSYFNKKLNVINGVEYAMPLGHYSENVHVEFAKYITETYLK